MKDPREAFGKNVRAYRKHRGWSQETLAGMTGLDRTYIGGVERGERNIALLNIVKISIALDVPLTLLMDFECK